MDSAASACQVLRAALERHQIACYFGAMLLGALGAYCLPHSAAWAQAIEPCLALMLTLTFLQVPLGQLGRALRQGRFLAALLAVNFVGIPLLVVFLLHWLPQVPLLRLGVLLVLLAPCIDYVVTFSHLGRADARLLLAATPLLLLAQMALLPLYLRLFLGQAEADLVRPTAFLHAFGTMILLPLTLAALLQYWAASSRAGRHVAGGLTSLTVPATALVLWLMMVAMLPQLGAAAAAVLQVLPVYLAFALAAPLLGWCAGRCLGLAPTAGRAVAFSAATRNSLVVLPLALAVPGAVPILPAVIVAQTCVELVFQLLYIRMLPVLGAATPTARL